MPDNNGVLDPRFIAIGSQEKAELIRAIQRAEGNIDCFGTAAEEECSQEGCLWREECFRESVTEEIR